MLFSITLERQSFPFDSQKSSLIGCALERQSLVSAQEFQESLKADKRNSDFREKEKKELTRKKRIQSARADRVPPEPDDVFLTVKIRHITMGLQSRKFRTTARMASVYDWAGSLSSGSREFHNQSYLRVWCKNQMRHYLTDAPI